METTRQEEGGWAPRGHSGRLSPRAWCVSAWTVSPSAHARTAPRLVQVGCKLSLVSGGTSALLARTGHLGTRSGGL